MRIEYAEFMHSCFVEHVGVSVIVAAVRPLGLLSLATRDKCNCGEA